jgi:hypothetical protein
MLKKYLFIWMLPMVILVATAGTNQINSNAAPLGSTGAPGENTCAKSTCHIGSSINAGAAQLAVEINSLSNQYTPHQTYDLTVSLAQTGIERFGFQVLALNENNQNVGQFIVTDSTRTQPQQGLGIYTGRNYITYKYLGTNPFSSGLGKWDFQWQAPDSYQGKIKFFVAAVAANNDGTDLGDSVYTKQLVLEPSVTGINEQQANLLSCSIFPNPTREIFTIQYTTQIKAKTQIQLIDMQGKIGCLLQETIEESGSHTKQIKVPSIPQGVYLVCVQNDNHTITKQIVIE